MKQFKKTLLVALVTSMAISTAVADGTIRFEGRIVEDSALVTNPSNECVTTIKKISENTLAVQANSGNKLGNCFPQTKEQASLQLQPIDKERAVLLVNYD